MKRFLLNLFLLAIPSSVFAQVNLTYNRTAAQLIEKLIGKGVTYSNPVLTCDSLANGSFTVVSSNLGLDSGIVLTSGRASTDTIWGMDFGINAPAFELASTDFSFTSSGAGDGQLDSLLAPSNVTSQDACVLEFDFVPTGDTLQFRYVFGSEEYTDYSCDVYNDIFAFFLTGPGYPATTNIALIPGTTIPVAVNSTTNMSINTPFDPTLCTGMGPGSPFSQYYVNNSTGSTVVYDGFTTVLTAIAPVQSCSTYHIKLAIADASDGLLDSGVFLEAGSFSSNAATLSFASTLPGLPGALLEGCQQGTVTVKTTRALPTPQIVHLYYSGTATKNADYSPAPDSVIIPPFDSVVSFTLTAIQDAAVEGVESFGIRTVNTCSFIGDSLGITIIEQLPLNLLSTDTAICQREAVTIPLHVSGDPLMQFNWTSTPASPINNPADTLTFASPTVTTVYTVTASIAGCPAGSASFTVSIEEPPIVDILLSDTSLCMRAPMKLDATVTPDNPGYTYSWEPAANLNDPAIKEPQFFSQELFDHLLRLTVTSPLGCTGSDSTSIRTKPPVVLINVTAEATVRYGDRIQLNADGAYIYAWYPTAFLDYPNEKDPIATPTEPVTFTVIGLNEYGCRDSAQVKLDIDYTMNEFIPTAFSPNNDGRNDLFRVVNLKHQRLLEFRVFNRWGQELYNTTNAEQGWDGTYRGIQQEVGVYYYLIRVALPNGVAREYKGDVTLVR